MEHLNFVNLIQAGTIATGTLGGLLLWLTKSKEFKGIAVLLFTIAFAACVNIIEESGLSRDAFIISPIFIMLFGPLTYLSAKLLIDKTLAKRQWLHLLPVIPFIFLTSYIQVVIALGTIWRLAYALLTVFMLLKYKRSMDEQRSDADEFSLNWLAWVLAVTMVFNLIDLIRLNIQHIIPYQLNIFGQGFNNALWLIVVMIIIIKLQMQKQMPKRAENLGDDALDNASGSLHIDESTQSTKENTHPTKENYQSLFDELDALITSNQWFLKPRLTLSDVSDFTGLQTRDISRAINLNTHKSFNEYINNYRVEFVCQALLENTEKSLTDISADAGFSSKASFNKVFKQFLGITPTEYKAQNQA